MRTVVQELKAILQASTASGFVKAAGGGSAHTATAREEGDEEDVVCAQCFCVSRALLHMRCPAEPGKHAVCEGCFGRWARQQLAEEERARFVACGARIVCPLCLPLQTPFMVDR